MKKMSSHCDMVPDWFSLDKYDSSYDASLVDWGLNLAIRKMLRGTLQRRAAGSELSEIDAQYLLLIKQHGFLPRVETRDDYEDARYDVMQAFQHDKGKGKGLVYSLPMVNAVDIADWVQWDTELRHKLALVKYQELFHHARQDPLSPSEEALADWHETDYQYTAFHQRYETITPYVCVDLGAPDENIIDAFKSWLRATRETCTEIDLWGHPQQIPERFSDKMIARWKRNAILPYLDLQLHQLENNIELPMHVLGNAIFPVTAEVDTTEAVRKTTRPSAEQALKLAWTVLHQAIRDEANVVGGKD